MQTPTQAQINAGLRYAGSSVTTLGAVVVAAGALPPDTVHSIVDASQHVLTDIKQTVGDIYVLIALVLPVATVILGKLGWNSASPSNQKQSLISSQPGTVVVETSSPAAAERVATAVAASPDVNKIVSSQDIADNTPSTKIVAK